MREWCEQFNIPNIDEVTDVWRNLLGLRFLPQKLMELEERFFSIGNYEPIHNGIGFFPEAFYPAVEIYAPLRAMATELNVSIPLFIETVFLHFAKRTLSLYRERSIPDEIFFATMSEFPSAIHDCYKREGSFGLRDYLWLANHLRLNLFRLGRFQYQYARYDEKKITLGGRTLKKGDLFLKLHVPEGEPIPREDRFVSYVLAYDFFGLRPTFFLCDSWLLYPAHKTMLGETSNIRSFLDDFKLIHSEEHRDYADMTRIFTNKNTSLTTAYLMRAKKGLPVGSGTGIFLFDGVHFFHE